MASEVYDMGNLIQLREECDPGYRITDYIRSHLAVVDLTPVNYHLLLAQHDSKTWGVKYNFNTAASDYAGVLKKYKLEPKQSLRLWLTDDTVISDNFYNNYNPNIIESGLNSLDGMSNTIKTMRQMTQSAGNEFLAPVQKKVVDTVNSGISATSSYLFGDDKLAKQLTDQAMAVTNTVGEVIFQGKHISLPKIWTSSSYSPTLTITIKLVSPYGHPEAVKQFIIVPLMYLMALISPKTSDGLSYGVSQPLYVNGYGVTNINLAAVQSVTMRRGGRETAFNIYKQPLILDIMISIQPLAEGFGSVVGDAVDVATIDDAARQGDIGGSMSGPAITTLGNIIQSLRPAPDAIVGHKVVALKKEHASAPSGRNISSARSAATGTHAVNTQNIPQNTNVASQYA